MRKRVSWMAFCAVLLSPFIIAQRSAQQPAPVLPPSVVGPELVAWSHLLRPQPMVSEGAAEQPPPLPAPMRGAEVRTGVICRNGSALVLSSATSSAYWIDDQEKAHQFEGMRVKVFGRVDARTNTLQLVRIEAIP
jgi:hypothetical protein